MFDWRLCHRGGAAVSKVRGHSGDRYSDVASPEPAVPQIRPNTWEDSIRVTSRAISRRWGSDGGVDEWSSDCDQRQQPPAAGNRYRRRMSDTGRISDWSKSVEGSEKMERLSAFTPSTQSI